MDPTDRIYLAAVLDARGWIQNRPTPLRPGFSVLCVNVSTRPDLGRWLVSTIGGAVVGSYWTVSGDEMNAALELSHAFRKQSIPEYDKPAPKKAPRRRRRSK